MKAAILMLGAAICAAPAGEAAASPAMPSAESPISYPEATAPRVVRAPLWRRVFHLNLHPRPRTVTPPPPDNPLSGARLYAERAPKPSPLRPRFQTRIGELGDATATVGYISGMAKPVLSPTELDGAAQTQFEQSGGAGGISVKIPL